MTIESKTLKVIGERTMHCGGCERTVEFALKQLPGVRRVKASCRTQRVDLTFDSQALNLERVCQKLDWIGYQAAEGPEASRS